MTGSVPNGGITPNEIWTTPQWITAWQAKADDVTGGTYTPPSPGVPTTVAAALTTANQPPSGFFYSQSGARVQRLEDRVFIGDATLNDGQGPTNPVSADWLTLWQQSIGIPFGSISSSQAAILTTTAAANVTSPYGLTVGTQTLHTNQNGQNSIGLAVYALNNSPTYTNSIYGMYIEGHRVNNVVNSVNGMEIDVTQRGALVAANPYAQVFGQTECLQLASGAQQGVLATATFATNVMTITLINIPSDIGLILNGWKVGGVGITAGTTITSFGTGTGGTGTYNLSTSPGTLTSRIVSVSPMFDNSAAINIQGNPTAFVTGINFGSYAITGGDGVNGIQPVPAITFAKNHGMYWYTVGGASTGAIYCTAATSAGATQLWLQDGAFSVMELSSNTVNFQVNGVVSAANYVYASAASTTATPLLGVTGSDTTVGLNIATKNQGAINFQSPAACSPTTGIGLFVTAAASSLGIEVQGSNGQYCIEALGNGTSGGSDGILIRAGTTAADAPLYIQNFAGTAQYAAVFGDGHGTLGYNGSSATISFSAAGAVTHSGAIGWNGAAPPTQVTGFGTPVGGAVIASYNITDAGGANSNTNKAVAEILTIMKSHGMIGN